RCLSDWSSDVSLPIFVLVGRDHSALSGIVDAVRSAGGMPVPCAQDVTTVEAPGRIVDAAIEAFGRIDVLINAAGVIASGNLEARSEERRAGKESGARE